MNVVSLLSKLHDLNVKLWLEDDRLHYAAPAGVISAGILNEIQQSKAAILDLLAEASYKPATSIPRAPSDLALTLSYAQRSLWFVDRVIRDRAAYNITLAVHIIGSLDIDRLARGLTEVVTRHDTLRLVIRERLGKPAPIVCDPEPIKLTTLAADGPEIWAKEARIPFDLEKGPLVRFSLFCIGKNAHVLLCVMHHVVADGESLAILMRELVTLYGDPSYRFPDLPVRYSDYTAWQQHRIEGDLLERHLQYWRRQLRHLQPLQLPLDRLRPAERSWQGDLKRCTLPTQLTQALASVSLQTGCTLFLTVLGAFLVLLARRTGQDDIAVGTPVSVRCRPELENCIGLFVNVVVLRANLDGDPTFRELMMSIKRVVAEAHAHQEVPFEKVVTALNAERGVDFNPLFRVLFAQQASPPVAVADGCTFTSTIVANKTAKFDLSVYVNADSERLTLSFEYSTDLFYSSSIARLLSQFECVLSHIPAHVDLPISSLESEWSNTESVV